LFFGVRRGIKDSKSYDDAGVFIKNTWGRNAIKLYVDNDNKPHFEIYDSLGKTIVYELKLPQ
jgi:ribosomal protein S18 acetylase RimI-like enzyme